MSRHTISQYLKGDPLTLCRHHGDCNTRCKYRIDPYLDFISDCIAEGMYPTDIHRAVIKQFDYQGSFNAFYNHLKRNEKQYGWAIKSRCSPNKDAVKRPKMITKNFIFKHLWYSDGMAAEQREYVFGQHPTLYIIDRCIREFRDMFQTQSIPRLHCFIEKYAACGIASLESFAKGLGNDLEAVEYAVSTTWSNGLVEGTNNRIKTVKRTMYGRCSRKLLEAKILLG